MPRRPLNDILLSGSHTGLAGAPSFNQTRDEMNRFYATDSGRDNRINVSMCETAPYLCPTTTQNVSRNVSRNEKQNGATPRMMHGKTHAAGDCGRKIKGMPIHIGQRGGEEAQEGGEKKRRECDDENAHPMKLTKTSLAQQKVAPGNGRNSGDSLYRLRQKASARETLWNRKDASSPARTPRNNSGNGPADSDPKSCRSTVRSKKEVLESSRTRTTATSSSTASTTGYGSKSHNTDGPMQQDLEKDKKEEMDNKTDTKNEAKNGSTEQKRPLGTKEERNGTREGRREEKSEPAVSQRTPFSATGTRTTGTYAGFYSATTGSMLADTPRPIPSIEEQLGSKKKVSNLSEATNIENGKGGRAKSTLMKSETTYRGRRKAREMKIYAEQAACHRAAHIEMQRNSLNSKRGHVATSPSWDASLFIPPKRGVRTDHLTQKSPGVSEVFQEVTTTNCSHSGSASMKGRSTGYTTPLAPTKNQLSMETVLATVATTQEAFDKNRWKNVSSDQDKFTTHVET